jgi:hypothetical protein
MKKSEEDLIVYGAACGVILLVTILSYVTYRALAPTPEKKAQGESLATPC